MSKSKPLRGPLLCWDIYAMHLAEQAINFNKQIEVEFLKGFKEKFGWTLDIEKLLAENDYEALVLTNFNQEIKWVNKGFTKMTGYPANSTKGKKPNFLQGKDSSENTKKAIRTHLKSGKHFKVQIINYKKNGTPYNCEIKIYQLKDERNKTTHLLALENQITM
ncbi:PAS domain-containing protein [uncultured Algibacter sp.]|uniref:PAS domain-containing protein n=1 Tax=uncultured Algibacter sp. TaxID=298659 RepID=UPI002606543D|nr:PAS domain-containing protein [uncultured Algibacter sp.]